MEQEEVSNSQQKAQRTNDERKLPVQPKKEHDPDRTPPRSCECKHDSKTEGRAKPNVELGEASLWPVN
jgi:hypothetical protein